MGGQIGVESTLGEGSVFYFLVTLDEAAEDAHTGDKAMSSTAHPWQLRRGGRIEADGSAKEHAAANTGAGARDKNSGENASTQTALTGAAAAGAGAGTALAEVAVTGADYAGMGAGTSAGTGYMSTPDLSDYRILLAEDIMINREVVLTLLEDSGIQIALATNGVEVLEALKHDAEGFDLIFMDLQMPEMDGLDATRRIRALPEQKLAELPIVAMTANVSQEDIDACIEAGMNDHLGKPICLEELYRVLIKYLPRKH
jgi:CheY-like chemotaxis protein